MMPGMFKYQYVYVYYSHVFSYSVKVYSLKCKRNAIDYTNGRNLRTEIQS